MNMQKFIDGSFGEGGGQVLRTSLALSLVTGTAISIENIRTGRKKPGLMQQHLTAVNAAARVGRAEVRGNELGSQKLVFTPSGIHPGEYQFTVGTAGSATLVLQTVLPALLIADAQSTLVLEGGTHNPNAPPFDFLERVFLPLINRLGGKTYATLDRPGFYPAGGGRFRAMIDPFDTRERFELSRRGAIKRCTARALVSRLPRKIAERELRVVGDVLEIRPADLHVVEIGNSQGPGNAVIVDVESAIITEVFTGYGKRGVPAERVAQEVAAEVREYISAGAPVGKHLADQLIIPLALSGGGRYCTMPLSSHALTNIEVVKQFLPVGIMVSHLDGGVWEIDIHPNPA